MTAGVDVMGREEELDAVRVFLDGLANGPSALLVEGDPGIGKTTLWRAGVEEAAQRGLRPLAASPAEVEARLSFALLGDLLEAVVEDILARLPEPQRRALGVALLLDERVGPPPDQRAVSVAFLNALRALAAEAPLVLAVDDLQWADSPSATALAFAARRLRDEPVGLLFFVRTSAHSGALGLDRALPEQRVRRMALGPLGVGALGRLLRERLRTAFPPPTLRRLHELSGGNPFFALELGRALGEGSLGLQPGEPLPSSLDVLVSDRLAALPRETREALAVAAAASAATLRLVEAVRGAPAEAVLLPAVQAEVIEVHGGRIRFTHPLLVSAAYAGVDEDRRRVLHRRLAAVAEASEERARHLALSSEGPDAGVARALEEAARGARSRGAPGAAAELGEQACVLTPPGEPADQRRRLIDTAGYLLEAGDSDRARSLLEQAVAGAPPGLERSKALHRLAWAWTYRDTATAERLFQRALAEASEPGVKASIERGLTWALQTAGDITAAAAHARRAVELSRRAGDSDLIALASADLWFIDALQGRGGRGLEHLVRLEQAARSLPMPGHAAWLGISVGGLSASSLLPAVLAWAGELSGARRLLERMQREGTERGDERLAPFTLNWLARVETLAGNWQEAARQADESYQSTLETGQDTTRAFVASTRAMIDARCGRAEAARTEAEETLALAGRIGLANAEFEARATLGFLELSLGRAADADGWLGSLHDDVRSSGFDDPTVFRFHPDAVETALALDRLAEAERLVAYLEERGRALEQPWTLATAARCRGLLLAARSELDRALAQLQASLERHRGLPEPFEHGRTLLALGATLRRAKRRGDARRVLEDALAVFQDLGAQLWAQRARDELGRIGGRRPSRDELTPAEERVAALVVEGLTNREVAARLFVTEHTVEAALVRAYAKLGVHSRTQLARKMAATPPSGSEL
jgi:DNA-binding CsgD family transcriptional regulator